MVTGPRPPPPAEVKIQHEKARLAWMGLIPNPEAHMRREEARPLHFRGLDRYRYPGEELWVKPKRPDGTRPEGIAIEKVWRDPKTGRFMKAHPEYRPPERRKKPAPLPR